MPTTIALPAPKSFPLRQTSQYLVLGVPLAIWAIALLLIAGSARYDPPSLGFDPQEVMVAF